MYNHYEEKETYDNKQYIRIIMLCVINKNNLIIIQLTISLYIISLFTIYMHTDACNSFKSFPVMSVSTRLDSSICTVQPLYIVVPRKRSIFAEHDTYCHCMIYSNRSVTNMP